MSTIELEIPNLQLPDITARIINYLETTKKLSPEKIEEVQKLRKSTNKPISVLLIEEDLIDEDNLISLLERASGYPALNPLEYLQDNQISKELIQKFPFEKCLESRILPIRLIENKLIVVMEDPGNNLIKSEVKQEHSLIVEPYVYHFSGIWSAIQQVFPESKDFDLEKWFMEQAQLLTETIDIDEPTGLLFMDVGKILKTPVMNILRMPLLPPKNAKKKRSKGGTFKIGYSDDPMATIKVVNRIIDQALAMGATDIHIEPFEDSTRLRYRKDSVLFAQHYLASELHRALINRFKILADLNLAEHRRAQEGILSYAFKPQHFIQLRLSVLPTLYGETAQLRVLDGRQGKVDFTELGMEEEQLELFHKNIHFPHGMVLVTGPTGSGKTTTLYSTLKVLNTEAKKIITMEDPIEYKLYGVTQVQANPHIGFGYSEALRSFLRQDPDILLLGEIRDKESAHTAIDAALTGHMLFSSLHTNDTCSTVARLLHTYNCDPLLLSEVLLMVVSQRLIRKLCDKCKEAHKVSNDELKQKGIEPDSVTQNWFYRSVGCDECNNTGYTGMTGVYEILDIKSELRDLLFQKANSRELLNAAKESGLKTLRENAFLKCYAGITSLEELQRRILYKF